MVGVVKCVRVTAGSGCADDAVAAVVVAVGVGAAGAVGAGELACGVVVQGAAGFVVGEVVGVVPGGVAVGALVEASVVVLVVVAGGGGEVVGFVAEQALVTEGVRVVGQGGGPAGRGDAGDPVGAVVVAGVEGSVGAGDRLDLAVEGVGVAGGVVEPVGDLVQVTIVVVGVGDTLPVRVGGRQ